ncbi:hypothetical protein EP7_005646 (plasmid) [Isosphaeraceae bacterium EP7]
MATLAQVEAEIVSRVGPWLTRAGKSAAATGSNPDLVGPISRSIRGAGGSVAALGVVSQADLDTVDAGSLDLMLELAEVYTLESLTASFSSTSIQELDYKETFSGGGGLAAAISALWKRLGKVHGFGDSAITAGVIDLNIGGHGDPTGFPCS